jgi:hypothetical protein
MNKTQTRVLAAIQDAKTATAETSTLTDTDTAVFQKELEHIDTINAKVRQNLDKAKAEHEAEELAGQYRENTEALEAVRAERLALLAGVEMPLDDLSIDEEGRLVYRNQLWDCMSGAEQLRVSVAITASIKPECGCVLLDGLERMDSVQLKAFAAWLAERDLQAIGTRVGTDGACSIVIDDGEVVDAKPKTEKAAKGKFDF